MAHKFKLKDVGMDTMEILYYERQAKRKKAYISKRRKLTQTKEKPTKNSKIEQNSDAFDINPRKSLYNMC